MVYHYQYNSYNSHHKVLVNLQASNMDALKNQNYGLYAGEGIFNNCVLCGV